MTDTDLTVVWGNCQAAPLAALLRGPMAAAGLDVVDVPPVFLVDEAELAHVHELVATAAVLVSQPIGDSYRWLGSSTAALAADLPAGGRLVTFPSAFHVGAVPGLVNVHGADGERVSAPLTDYHDLRMIVAAARGLTPEQAVRWWPAPTVDGVLDVARTSSDELRRRERELDVGMADLVDGPDAFWTMNHPSNRVLHAVATRVLDVLGIDEPVSVPEREFLAERRAPIEAAVVAAHGWDAAAVRPLWQVDGREIPALELVTAHLELYAERPDVVADSLVRHRTRLEQLGLSGTDA